MNLADTPEQAAFRAELRDWLAAQPPTTDARAWGRTLYDAGYAGLTWPTAYGGGGRPLTTQGIFVEECALAGAPDEANVIGLNMVAPTLIAYGAEQQCAEHLPAILRGDTICSQAFSEAEAGSDLANLSCHATPISATDESPAGFRLDGVKLWSSYAAQADLALLLARTGEGVAERHRGLTCFLVDLHAPGVMVSPIPMLHGPAGFASITLTGAWVEAGQVVGEVGAGWAVAMTTLGHERGTFGITLTARLTRRFRELLEMTSELGVVSDAVDDRLAELWSGIEALRFTGYRVLWALEERRPGPDATLLKLRWSELHQQLVRLGWTVAVDHGHAGWVERWQTQLLRSRGNSLEGGTSEILRRTLATRTCGLPKGA